jgi:hypothetical protein
MAHNGFRDRSSGRTSPANRHSEVPEGKTEGKKVIAKTPGGLVGSEELRPLAASVEPGRDGTAKRP